MGVKTVSTTRSESTSQDSNSTDPADQIPDPDELLDYLAEHTEKDHDELENQAADLRDKFQFLTPVSSYYHLGQKLGLNPSEAFGTKDHDTSLDIANIQPEMSVTVQATVDRVSISDPDHKDWTRQDIWLTDDTGTIKLVLWNEDTVDSISTGDDVKLVDGWSKTYNGSVQLSLGKNGELRWKQGGEWTTPA